MWPEAPVSLFGLFISDDTNVPVSAWYGEERVCPEFYLTWHTHGILERDTFCCSFWLLRVVVRMCHGHNASLGLLEAGAGSSFHSLHEHCK